MTAMLESAAVMANRPDDPIRGVSFYEATYFAELLGKRLPTEAEYLAAATGGGRRAFPWGDSPGDAAAQGWRLGPVGICPVDRTPGPGPPILGLYSNVAEWTSSRAAPQGSPAGFD